MAHLLICGDLSGFTLAIWHLGRSNLWKVYQLLSRLPSTHSGGKKGSCVGLGEAGDPLTGLKAHPCLTLHTRAVQMDPDRRELLSRDDKLGGLLGSDIKATGNSG